MRGYRIYLSIAILLVCGYLVLEYNKPVPTNWDETYSPEHKGPFGTYLLAQRLTDITPAATQFSISKSPVYNTLKGQNYRNAAYVIVAPSASITREDWAQLSRFAAAGNQVFLSAPQVGKVLPARLKFQLSDRLFPTDTSRSFNFTNRALKRSQPYRFDSRVGNRVFRRIDTAHTTILGTDEDGDANLIRYPLGKGAIYLLADPSLLSNFQLLDHDGADYAARCLSYLGDTRHIIFDHYYSGGSQQDTDMMRVFFNNPPLRYAYYLSIGGLLLFILFEIKRRQRIIPIQDPLNNASVEFAQVVGSLYFHEGNHLDIANKRLTYLKDFLRTRYFLDYQHLTADVLEQKTGARPATVRLLLQRIRGVETATSLTEGELLAFNEIIEQFYTQTRKI